MVCNPLSKASDQEGNLWSKRHKEAEAMAEIWTDVTRTFQDREPFTNLEVLKCLQRALYVWTKKSGWTYKQVETNVVFSTFNCS